MPAPTIEGHRICRYSNGNVRYYDDILVYAHSPTAINILSNLLLFFIPFTLLFCSVAVRHTVRVQHLTRHLGNATIAPTAPYIIYSRLDPFLSPSRLTVGTLNRTDAHYVWLFRNKEDMHTVRKH